MQLLKAKKEWSDNISAPFVMEQVKPFVEALEKHATTTKEQHGARKADNGLSAIFLGTPGSGRTTIAAALGKSAGMEVYRVDLSQAVSKYIVKQKKILPKYLTRLQTKARSCFLMKQMLYLANAHRKKMHMINMLTRKLLTSCNA